MITKTGCDIDCLDCYEENGECGDVCRVSPTREDCRDYDNPPDKLKNRESEMNKENEVKQFDFIRVLRPFANDKAGKYDLFLEWLENYYSLVFIPHPYMIIYVGYCDEGEREFVNHSFYAIIFSERKKFIVDYDFIGQTLKVDKVLIPLKVPVWNSAIENF